MNRQRRVRLQEAVRYLSKAETIVDAVCGEEEDSMDNVPESLQCSERFELMEEAIDNLNDAIDSIGEAKMKIETAIG